MKKLKFSQGLILGLMAVGLLGTVFGAVFGPTPHSNGGWVVGESSAKLGFFGATPVSQRQLTNTTATAVTNYAYSVTPQTADVDVLVPGGTTSTVTFVTNVIIASTSTNTIAGFGNANSVSLLIQGLGDTNGLGLFNLQ